MAGISPGINSGRETRKLHSRRIMSEVDRTPKGEKVMTDSECRLLFIKLDEIQNELKEIKTPSGWLDLQKATEYTSLSLSSLNRAIRSGKLKCSRQHGKLLLRRIWLDQVLILGHCKRVTPKQRIELEL